MPPPILQAPSASTSAGLFSAITFATPSTISWNLSPRETKSLSQFTSTSTPTPHFVQTYADFNAGAEEILHDVALQIAAAKPSYVNSAEVPADVLDKEKEIMLVQMQNDPKNANKPKEILEKIVAGKMGKFYQDNCLLDQAYVKDDSQKISQVISNKFKVTKFVRFEMGEGLEKKSENLQDEVAKQIDAMKK